MGANLNDNNTIKKIERYLLLQNTTKCTVSTVNLDVNYTLWLCCIKVGSSFGTNVSVWWVILIMGKTCLFRGIGLV